MKIYHHSATPKNSFSPEQQLWKLCGKQFLFYRLLLTFAVAQKPRTVTHKCP